MPEVTQVYKAMDTLTVVTGPPLVGPSPSQPSPIPKNGQGCLPTRLSLTANTPTVPKCSERSSAGLLPFLNQPFAEASNQQPDCDVTPASSYMPLLSMVMSLDDND